MAGSPSLEEVLVRFVRGKAEPFSWGEYAGLKGGQAVYPGLDPNGADFSKRPCM